MSITEFDKLISEIKLEIEEQNVNSVLENIIILIEESQKMNKKELEFMKTSIRFKKI